MNKSARWIAVGLLAAGTGAAQSPQTFTGEMADSSCAKMGSHAA